jgi:formate C-acetyltransferase
LGTDSIYYCIWYGSGTAATPNGRKKGQPLSKNLSAEVGKDRNGILAYMQTVLKIDMSDFVDSAVLDFTLHPSSISGEKGLQDFKNLVKTFFAHGGFAMQGNIVSADELKKALNEPEKYSNLQIRVCGWNEYFVEMDSRMQNMFIENYSNC